MSKRVRREEGTGDGGPPVSDRSRRLSKVLGKIDGFQLWSSVRRPMVLRTRFTSLNRAMRCGGIPGGMLGDVHGPYQGGKSLFLAEVLYSVWASGGWGLFVDAECRAVDLTWYRAVVGALEEVSYFKPRTFEEAIERVQEFRDAFRGAKAAGELPPGAFCGVGVDSINRLTPGNELEELLAGKVEARGYPLRALLTSKWLDKIIPTLERDEVLVFVRRESTKLDAMPGQKTYRVKGGTAVSYDAGWEVRVTAPGRYRVRDSKDGALAGQKHEVVVEKNSMGPHLSEVANFYSAGGAEDGVPLGLDLAREVREECVKRGLVEFRKGVGYVMGEDRLAASKPEFLDWLRAEEDGVPRWWKLADRLDAEFAVPEGEQ